MTRQEVEFLFWQAAQPVVFEASPLLTSLPTRKEEKAYAKGVIDGMLLAMDNARLAQFLLEHSSEGGQS
jgi:hypothetical protein